MKKSAIFLIALAVAMSAVSCSEKASGSVPSSVVEAEQLSFREADIDMAADLKSLISLDRNGDFILIFGENKKGSYTLMVTDKSFSDSQSFNCPVDEGEMPKAACMGKFGTTAVLTYSGEKTMLRTFSKDGELFKTYDLGNIISDEETGIIMIATDDGYIVNIGNERLAVIDKSGNYLGDAELNGDRLYGIAKNTDGIPTVLLSSGEECFTAALEGTELGEKTKCSSLSSSPYAICSGFGEYSLAADLNDGLYGLHGDSWVKLTDYMDNSFAAFDMWGMICTDEKEFVCMISSSGAQRLTMMTERDISELRSKKVISFGMMSNNSVLEDIIKDFNSSNEEYRLNVKAYSTPGGLITEASEKLREDILSGDPPDMIWDHDYFLSVDSFGARDSIFVDMYELIDNDPNISRDDFVDGYLEALSHHGKLYMISPGFSVSTMAVKDKYLGGLTHWNTEQMLGIISARPEEMGVIPYSEDSLRSELTASLINISELVDYENAECHFDSPEFINVLKSIQEHELGITNSQLEILAGDEGVYLHEGNGIRSLYFRNDNYLIDSDPINNFNALQELVHAKFNEPVTLIGYPDDFSAGTTFQPAPELCVSILRSCDDIEGAWGFIRDELLSDKFYSGYTAKGMFPAVEKYLDEQLEGEKSVSEYVDDDGETVNMDYYYLDEEYEKKEYYEPFSDDEAEKYGEFIKEAAKHRRRWDNTISEIMKEELTVYYEGEKTAEETAELIQNRVSIYLSESYG